MLSISLDAPPRPADGDGDVILKLSGQEIVFQWEDGKFVGVSSKNVAGDFSKLETFTLEAKVTSGVSCECCVRPDGGGPAVCWTIPCGSSCP